MQAAKHKELVQQQIKEELKQAKLETAQATLITPAPAPVKLNAPTPGKCSSTFPLCADSIWLLPLLGCNQEDILSCGLGQLLLRCRRMKSSHDSKTKLTNSL